MGHVSPSLSTAANSINQSVGRSVGRSVSLSVGRVVGRSVSQSQPRFQGLSLGGGRPPPPPPPPPKRDPGNEVESISQSIGRSVNKASGLTDLARPRGVAVDFRVNVVQ